MWLKLSLTTLKVLQQQKNTGCQCLTHQQHSGYSKRLRQEKHRWLIPLRKLPVLCTSRISVPANVSGATQVTLQ